MPIPSRTISTAERMKHVREACAAAPAGPAREAARACYAAAEAARREMLERKCNRQLDAALRALAQDDGTAARSGGTQAQRNSGPSWSR